MRTTTSLLALTAATLLAIPAEAHFLWVALETGKSGQQSAQLSFAESSVPGDAALVDRILNARLWMRTSAGQLRSIPYRVRLFNEFGVLHSQLSQPARQLSAECLYGVFSRGSKTMLLKYHAKWLASDQGMNEEDSAATHLELDVRPRIRAEKLSFQVVLNGTPVDDSQVMVETPAGEVVELTSNSQGWTAPIGKVPGRYSVRARVIVEESGQYRGSDFEEIRHYSTLTLDIASADEPATVAAADLLYRARQARANWKDFAGFSAQIAVNVNGLEQSGSLRVDRDGGVILQGIGAPLRDDVLQPLRSLVMHRLAVAEKNDGVSYPAGEKDHPLGQLVKLDYDTAMASEYRIQGEEIREVSRQTERGRFTISVLATHRNQDGQTLPALYNVCSWNNDGGLERTTTVRNEWTRVGGYDLPTLFLSVSSAGDQNRTTQIRFWNHEIPEAQAK